MMVGELREYQNKVKLLICHEERGYNFPNYTLKFNKHVISFVG